jgi:DinB family protein
MRHILRCALTPILATAVIASLSAQTREGVMGDLLKDVGDVEKKVLDLAKAIPESAYAWRPSPGVRSTGEVLQHIAADNYFLPVLMDKAAPKETGITKEYSTAAAFEKRTMNKDAIIVELGKSFAFLRTSMNSTPDAQLNTAMDVFGQKSTARGLWITTTTHLHEHLGQLIAYARSNKITPPWSK